MKPDWDDPFGREISLTGAAPSLTQPGKTIITPGLHIDTTRIRAAHKKLAESYFEELLEASSEMVGIADPFTQRSSQVGIVTKIVYRLPDAPWILESFTHETLAHKVTLAETGEKSHPIVERLFPQYAIRDLPDPTRQAVEAAFDLARRPFTNAPRPTHFRTVFPEILKYLVDWMKGIEGPIKNVNFIMRPVGRDFRNATHLHLN